MTAASVAAVVDRIAEQPGSTIGELCDYFEVDAATIWDLVIDAERLGQSIRRERPDGTRDGTRWRFYPRHEPGGR